MGQGAPLSQHRAAKTVLRRQIPKKALFRGRKRGKKCDVVETLGEKDPGKKENQVHLGEGD